MVYHGNSLVAPPWLPPPGCDCKFKISCSPNPLIMLQKVGALGSHLRGKSVAISLSPGWFLTAKPGCAGYEGNFSPMAATEMVFGSALDFDVKRKIASRMVECPNTLEERPLLELALKRLASGSLPRTK